MKASAVIVHWNTPDSLKKLLTLLEPSNALQVIVVDNNSNKYPIWIQKEHPDVVYIQNNSNRGYAFACNQGLLASKGEWVVFINPDVKITESDISKLIHLGEEQAHDAFSPFNGDRGYRKPLPSLLSLFAEFTPLKYIPLNGMFTKHSLWGGCLFVKRDVLWKLGGWDERFFIWFEDVDLTKRLITDGYKTGFIPYQVKHKGGESFRSIHTKQKQDIFFHSLDVYTKKHFSHFSQFFIRPIISRYTDKQILPVLKQGITMTVPNVKKELLDIFLKQNAEVLKDLAELIIVTSAITNAEVWEYRNKYPSVRFIPIFKNYGFAHTVNIGLRCSPTPFLGTVNDDVEIKNPLHLLTHHIPDNTGSINPIIYSLDGSIESAGIDVLKKGKAEPRTQIDSNTLFETDATNGACVIYTNDALQQTGIYDERFGSYLEDIDLSLRIKRKGFINLVNNQVRVVHQKHSTSATVLRTKKQWLDFKNWILVIIKNWSVSDYLHFAIPIFIERGRNLNGVFKSLRQK